MHCRKSPRSRAPEGREESNEIWYSLPRGFTRTRDDGEIHLTTTEKCPEKCQAAEAKGEEEVPHHVRMGLVLVLENSNQQPQVPV